MYTKIQLNIAKPKKNIITFSLQNIVRQVGYSVFVFFCFWGGKVRECLGGGRWEVGSGKWEVRGGKWEVVMGMMVMVMVMMVVMLMLMLMVVMVVVVMVVVMVC